MAISKMNGVSITTATKILGAVRSKVLGIDISSGGGTPYSVSYRINNTTEDAEEYTTTSTDIASGDIWLDTGSWSGFIYQGLNIPVGATITNAYIQFEAYASDSGTCVSPIYGQKGSNPALFANTAYNISSRTRTTATINWNISAWTTDERSTNEQTPDISSIIQEIIDDPSYSSTDRIGIIFAPASGNRKTKSNEATGDTASEILI